MRGSLVSPDEATQRDQVRRFLDLLIAACLAGGAVEAAAALVVGSPRWLATALLLGALAVWLAAFARRVVGRAQVESVVLRVAVVLVAAVVGITLLQPFIALVTATALLIPIAAALPYLETRSLRRLMLLAWAASVATVAAGFLPDASAAPAAVMAFVRLWALAIVIGLVFFLLYQSSERLKASSREFRRLFGLSSDLAATTDPGVLGELVARHLAQATGFEECVIYALAPATGRLAPFGSHPAERALETDPASLSERPALGRVIHDRARIVIDVADAQADPAEQARLRALGREVMLLLPLVARSEPVGVAELTTSGHHAIDERRLALARTLAFEAAMAIENGRLYHALRHLALHDPLTGLANRSLFFDRAEHALARLARHAGAMVAVLFIDLDDFKAVNDTFGHARGDRLLTLVGARLRGVLRPGDTVARLGGDEFVLLLEDLASDDEALVVAQRAIDTLAAPFDLAGQPVRVSASIGVALCTADGATADELVREADLAMYAAKQAGKGRTVRFSPGLPPSLRTGAAPEAITAHPSEPAARAAERGAADGAGAEPRA